MRSTQPLSGRLAAWVVGLFPTAWRDRYGDELRLLIEQRTVTFGDVADVIRTALGERVRVWAPMSFVKGVVSLAIAAAVGVAAMRGALLVMHVAGLVGGVIWEGL